MAGRSGALVERYWGASEMGKTTTEQQRIEFMHTYAYPAAPLPTDGHERAKLINILQL